MSRNCRSCVLREVCRCHQWGPMQMNFAYYGRTRWVQKAVLDCFGLELTCKACSSFVLLIACYWTLKVCVDQIAASRDDSPSIWLDVKLLEGLKIVLESKSATNKPIKIQLSTSRCGCDYFSEPGILPGFPPCRRLHMSASDSSLRSFGTGMSL